MKRSAVIVGTFATFAILASSAAANAQVELECEAEGAGDISMSADYEERRSRRKFSTEFEADPRAGFTVGQRMTVLVEGVNVGSVTLRRVTGGDLQGDLNLDNTPDGGERPFPQNFPEVGQNSRILIRIAGETVLGCRLR